MDPLLREAAEAAPGFMPPDEGLALYAAALLSTGPLLEVGSYLGKSTLYLAAAARALGTKVITVDHHRGSEEHQPGWDYHDPSLVDSTVGRIDTLPGFRHTIASAGAEDVVVAVVARAEDFAQLWSSPRGVGFLDGCHTEESALRDYHGWGPHLDGILAVHDVFPDPADGGQAPFHVYETALRDGFEELPGTGSLRVLRRAGRRH